MNVSPGKFQAICIRKRAPAAIESFKMNITVINFEDNVTLSGVNIDFQLSCTEHIVELCKKRLPTASNFETPWEISYKTW